MCVRVCLRVCARMLACVCARARLFVCVSHAGLPNDFLCHQERGLVRRVRHVGFVVGQELVPQTVLIALGEPCATGETSHRVTTPRTRVAT